MNICHIQYAYYPGQGNIALYEYTQALSRLGNNTDVIVAGRKEEKSKDNINDVNVYRVSFPLVSMKNLGSLFFFIKAVKELKRAEKIQNFDIVHVYMGPGSFLVPLFGNKKKKYVLDVRSGGIKGRFSSYLAKIIINIESKFFDSIIVLDEGVAKKIFGNKDIHIVCLGANLETFKPGRNENLRKKLGIAKDDIAFIYTGSVHPARNLKNIIYAFKEVTTNHENTKLLLVGEGKDLNNLKNTAEMLNVKDKIIFTGYIDYKKVPDMINAADIAISYVPVTPEYEFQPLLKTVEYIFCEIPTIATNTAGNRKFINHRYNGILVDDGCNSLADAMIMLIEDVPLRETLKKNCRDSVAAYDWKTIVENDLIPVYEKLTEAG